MGRDHSHEGTGRLTLRDGVLFGFDDLVARWVRRRIKGFMPELNARALGVVRHGELVAGVVYERFNGVHLEVSIAVDSPLWASRKALAHLFGYPFHQLGCEAISVIVPSTNLASLNLATKLGFQPEAFIKFAAPDGSHLIVLKHFRNTCDWIRGDDGQGQFEGASGS